MRRIILLATVAAVMAAMMMVSALSVSSQTMPGEDVHCGPWVQDWNISEGWWYFWWLRHCHNPSIEGGWHIEWDGWEWWGPVS